MNKRRAYTSRLGAGLGLVEETLALLDLWEGSIGKDELYQKALESGRFPNISARRLGNIIKECFMPRYLCNEAAPALTLKNLKNRVPVSELLQFMFLFTARVNPILYDFIGEVYWPTYAEGKESVSNEQARVFVAEAIAEGRTAKEWSGKVSKNVAGYLTGCR